MVAAVALLATVLIVVVACGRETENTKDPVGRPNVILVLADDLDRAVFERSTLDEAWAPEGASFTNALATTSLCCPSRASILRGQYAHNTGLVTNDNAQPGGGARFFRESGLDDETLATVLRNKGYETWFGGKYLNEYEKAGGLEGYVPPGWDNWFAYVNRRVVNENGAVGDLDGHYTDWLSARSEAFIEDQRSSNRPFFMQISTLDTHTPFVIPERHRDAYSGQAAPKPPSFDEADVSDKPGWVRAKSPLERREVERFDRRHVGRMRSALTLEDLSRNVIGALERTKQLDDTYLIFTSDNGYHMGLHRIRGAKWTSYTEAHEVPFVARGPGVPPGASFDQLIANIDIAPTMLDLANIPPPDWMDGRSFAPFLDGTPPETWRSSLLIEGAKGEGFERPAYAGIRREQEVYVDYANGEQEYYDLAKDPHQLENRPQDAPETMKQDLEGLKSCAGEACREAERP